MSKHIVYCLGRYVQRVYIDTIPTVSIDALDGRLDSWLCIRYNALCIGAGGLFGFDSLSRLVTLKSSLFPEPFTVAHEDLLSFPNPTATLLYVGFSCWQCENTHALLPCSPIPALPEFSIRSCACSPVVVHEPGLVACLLCVYRNVCIAVKPEVIVRFLVLSAPFRFM